MENVSLPPQLPILPILNQVLLPTAFIRVQVSAKATKSVSLLEHLSTCTSKELLVAVVPNLAPADGKQGTSHEGKHAGQHEQQPRIATAARVLQLSRLIQSGDWVVLLEGLCRIAIDSSQQNHGEAFDSANITQLELRPGSSPNHPPTSYSHGMHATASTITHATATTGSGSSSSAVNALQLGVACGFWQQACRASTSNSCLLLASLLD